MHVYIYMCMCMYDFIYLRDVKLSKFIIFSLLLGNYKVIYLLTFNLTILFIALDCDCIQPQLCRGNRQVLKTDLRSVTGTIHNWGARCSSVVRAFTHGAMGRRVDPSWWTH